MTASFVETSLAYHRALGRPMDCSYIVWLQAQAGRPCQAVRAEAVQRQDWTARNAVSGIALTIDTLDGEALAATHLLYARAIASQPKDISWRPFVLHLVREKGAQIAPAALTVLQDWLRAD
jgi:hypothetical protein